MVGARVTTLVTLRKCTSGFKRKIKILNLVLASTNVFQGGLGLDQALQERHGSDFFLPLVVLIGCAVSGLLRAGVRETCKCGFCKVMTRWTKMRTTVSLCSRERGAWCEEPCYAGRKGGNRGRGGKEGCWSREGGRLNMSWIVSGRLGGGSSR